MKVEQRGALGEGGVHGGPSEPEPKGTAAERGTFSQCRVCRTGPGVLAPSRVHARPRVVGPRGGRGQDPGGQGLVLCVCTEGWRSGGRRA